MDQTQAIADLLRMLRRRAAIILAVSVIGIAGSVGYALIQPPVYETSARILVESQQIPSDLARSTVNMSAAERLQLIEQRLTSRNYLISIIEEFDLFSGAEGMTINQKIELLRQAIRVESILVSGQNRSGETEIFSFTITMRHGDAQQAADIVNTFVETAVAENLRVRAERARDTRAYFQEQVARVADQIILLEGQISNFKLENEGSLPESLEYRRDELIRLQESAMEIDRRLLEVDDEHLTMELALAGGAPVRTGELTPQSPEEAELRRLSLELAQKRRILSPDNPELARLQERISAIAELVPAAAVTDALALGPDGPSPEQEDVLVRQMALLENQVELLREQRATIDERRATLERSIQETPQVGVALNSLERRLAELQDQHSALVQRFAEARTGEELETNEQSERFRVVEDALAPDYPVEPNRKKIVALGSGASMALAFALALLIEMMRPAIRTSGQMERQLGIRPVISIPTVRTRWERRRRRLAWATALLVVALGGGLAMTVARDEDGPARMLAAVGMEGLLGVPPAGASAADGPAGAGTPPDEEAGEEAGRAPADDGEADELQPEPVAAEGVEEPLPVPPDDQAAGPRSPGVEGVTEVASVRGAPDPLSLPPDDPGEQTPLETSAAGTPAADLLSDPAVSPGAEPPSPDALTTASPAVVEPLPIRPAGSGEAAALFRQALDLGPSDPVQARALYGRAAALGHARAAQYLGQIHETGDGVAPDMALAEAWYALAEAGTGEADTDALPADGTAMPLPLLVARQQDGTVDLVWSGAGGQTTFLVEFAEAPDAGPRFRGEVAGQTLSVELPPEIRFWRVAPLRDGETLPAAWMRLGS